MKDKITSEQIQLIDKSAGVLRAALSGKEADKIKSASDDLSKVLQKIGQEIYAKVAQKPGEPQAQQTPPPGVDPTGGADKVGDAECRAVKDQGSR